MRIGELETPALLIEQPVLNANIERMADYCRAHQVNLRVDVGCHKIPMIAYKQIAAGACGIACRTLNEVQEFADAGFHDILISRSVLSVAELESLLDLAKQLEAHLTTDSLAAVNEISRLSERMGLQTSILIEIDDNGNRNRSKMPPETLEIVRRIIALPSLKLAGVVVKPAPSVASTYVIETINRLETGGIPLRVVSCVDTGHLFQIHEIPQMTELCVGAYTLFDYSHVCRNECTLADCALAILTTVIDTPSKNLAIVNAGTQTFTKTHPMHTDWLPASSCPLAGDKVGKVFGVTKNSASATLCHLTEAYGHLSMTDNQFKVGEKVCIIPANLEATISAHDTFAFVQDDRVLEILPILKQGLLAVERD